MTLKKATFTFIKNGLFLQKSHELYNKSQLRQVDCLLFRFYRNENFINDHKHQIDRKQRVKVVFI